MRGGILRSVASWQPECRMQFNQNAGIVEVQVFAKQLNKQRERVTVEIQESSLKVEVKDATLQETEYLLEEKLYQPIVVDASKWDVWSTQINIKLKKADPAIVWPDLKYSDAPVRPLRLCCGDLLCLISMVLSCTHCAASTRWCKHR
jgi:trans-aconitate methyltransferase